MQKVLCVIPARGGSKSIPKKNIKPLLGKPLITYTIEEARKSEYLDRIVISTDDPETAMICKELGAEVIMRPAEFATDTASTELALVHVVKGLARTEGYMSSAVVTLEPTSPLRTHKLIDRCVEVLWETGADSVISVKKIDACLGTMMEGRFEYLIKNQPRRRQDREPLYLESSTVYVTRTETLLERGSVLGEKLYAVLADDDEAIDINTPLDLVIAEAVMRWRQGRGGKDGPTY